MSLVTPSLFPLFCLPVAFCSNAIKFAARRVHLVVSLQLPAAEDGSTGAYSSEPASRSSRGLSLLFSPRRGVTTAVESRPLLASGDVASVAATPVAFPAHASCGRRMIRFAVEDDGAGIPAEEQALLFKPFAQAVAGIRKQGGTGLGLTICKALVEAHGGEIGFESTPGKHTAFTVDIPFSAAQAVAAARAGADAPLLTGGADASPPAAASPLGRQVLPSVAPLHDRGSLAPGSSAPVDGSGDSAVSGEAPAVAAVDAVRVTTGYHGCDATSINTSAADFSMARAFAEAASTGVDEGSHERRHLFSIDGHGDGSPSAEASAVSTDATAAAACEALSSEAVLPSNAAPGAACSVSDSGSAASAASVQLQYPASLPLLRLRAKDAVATPSTPHALSPAVEGTFSAATDSSAAVVASWSCASSTAAVTPTSSRAASPVAAAHQRYHFLVVDDGA